VHKLFLKLKGSSGCGWDSEDLPHKIGYSARPFLAYSTVQRYTTLTMPVFSTVILALHQSGMKPGVFVSLEEVHVQIVSRQFRESARNKPEGRWVKIGYLSSQLIASAAFLPISVKRQEADLGALSANHGIQKQIARNILWRKAPKSGSQLISHIGWILIVQIFGNLAELAKVGNTRIGKGVLVWSNEASIKFMSTLAVP